MPRKTNVRLTHAAFFKMTEYLRTVDTSKFRDLVQLAANIKTGADIEVTTSTLKSALDLLKMPQPGLRGPSVSKATLQQILDMQDSIGNMAFLLGQCKGEILRLQADQKVLVATISGLIAKTGGVYPGPFQEIARRPDVAIPAKGPEVEKTKDVGKETTKVA